MYNIIFTHNTDHFIYIYTHTKYYNIIIVINIICHFALYIIYIILKNRNT